MLDRYFLSDYVAIPAITEIRFAAYSKEASSNDHAKKGLKSTAGLNNVIYCPIFLHREMESLNYATEVTGS